MAQHVSSHCKKSSYVHTPAGMVPGPRAVCSLLAPSLPHPAPGPSPRAQEQQERQRAQALSQFRATIAARASRVGEAVVAASRASAEREQQLVKQQEAEEERLRQVRWLLCVIS